MVDVQCGGGLVWWMSFFTHGVMDVWCGGCLCGGCRTIHSNHCSHFEYLIYDLFVEKVEYLAEKHNDATWCYLVDKLSSFDST